MKYYLMFIGEWIGFFFLSLLIYAGMYNKMSVSSIAQLFMGKEIVIIFLVSWIMAAVLTVVLYTEPLKKEEIEEKKKSKKKDAAQNNEID